VAIHNTKRIIDYTLESVVRLQDLRQIVGETQMFNGLAVITFADQCGDPTDTLNLIITEDGPISERLDFKD
jgi:hypothetical protein